ncbi:MAG: hypothetical protein ABW277_20945 [Longimicrobiaceae bacterium]
MRRKLMGLSALVCLAGGATLLAPAPAEAAYPSCEYYEGKPCSGRSGMLCTHDYDGSQDTLVCWGGTFVYA